MLTALHLLKDELRNSRKLFEGTTADLTEDMLHKDPGGKALPVGAVFAHQVFWEDIAIQSLLQGKEALYDSAWKDKTGVSKPMPAMDENWSKNNEEWARTVRISLSPFLEYTKAVYDATDRYVNTLTDENLEKEIDLGSWGKMTVAYFLMDLIIAHSFCLSGEISALKGIQGYKGYPF